MSGDTHVRICERLGVRFPRATRPVVHCRSQAEAEHLLAEIGERLAQCKLTMHPDKSKVVYCKDSNRRKEYPQVQFTFLGFTFMPRVAVNKQGQIFTGFLPAVSRDAIIRMLRTIKSWQLQRQTSTTIEDLSARYNPVLRGWWNFYSSFYQSAMDRVHLQVDRKLAYWARRKHKKLAGHLRLCGWNGWRDIARDCSSTGNLYVVPRLDNGSRMTRERHVRICERLGGETPPAYSPT